MEDVLASDCLNYFVAQSELLKANGALCLIQGISLPVDDWPEMFLAWVKRNPAPVVGLSYFVIFIPQFVELFANQLAHNHNFLTIVNPSNFRIKNFVQI